MSIYYILVLINEDFSSNFSSSLTIGFFQTEALTFLFEEISCCFISVGFSFFADRRKTAVARNVAQVTLSFITSPVWDVRPCAIKHWSDSYLTGFALFVALWTLPAVWDLIVDDSFSFTHLRRQTYTQHTTVTYESSTASKSVTGLI